MLLATVPIAVLFILAIVLDSSTHPYDILEAEPEVVSGYHTDLGGVLFMVIYLTEGILLLHVPLHRHG